MTDYMNKDQQKKVIEQLERVLGNSFALYMKTHAYHWNVEGPYFASLHALFEEQYRDMWAALDEIAERIRALGAKAPVTAQALIDNAEIPAAKQTVKAMDMVKDLAEGNEALSKILAEAIAIASDNGDESTADLFVGRQRAHDQFAWMLRVTAE